jgi:hypothetical protein
LLLSDGFLIEDSGPDSTVAMLEGGFLLLLDLDDGREGPWANGPLAVFVLAAFCPPFFGTRLEEGIFFSSFLTGE